MLPSSDSFYSSDFMIYLLALSSIFRGSLEFNKSLISLKKSIEFFFSICSIFGLSCSSDLVIGPLVLLCCGCITMCGYTHSFEITLGSGNTNTLLNRFVQLISCEFLRFWSKSGSNYSASQLDSSSESSDRSDNDEL